MRVAALEQAGGFNASVIAGEEPALCVRLRRDGWKILRIDAEMSIHDARDDPLRQWWTVRCGYAYAQGAFMHAARTAFSARHHRAIVWGCLIPGILLAAAWPSDGWALLGFLLYPIQVARIGRRVPESRPAGATRSPSASACMASKVPEFLGLCRFYLTHIAAADQAD